MATKETIDKMKVYVEKTEDRPEEEGKEPIPVKDMDALMSDEANPRVQVQKPAAKRRE